MTNDMTTGRPAPLIFRFALPLLLGNLLQQAYNIVDAAIVGRYLGINALSAVGASSSVLFLIIGLCIGTCSGCSIPVAQKFGAREEREMRRTIANCLYFGIAFSLVVTLATTLLCRHILSWMGTGEIIFEDACTYLWIIFLGIPCTMLYNMVAGILRALGDSKTPFLFLMVSAALNVGMDLLFIIAFQWGVAGAAIATILAQGISGALCLLYMRAHFGAVLPRGEEWHLDGRLLLDFLTQGVPMGLQCSVTAIGVILLQSGINSLGFNEPAAYAAAIKLKMFFICPFDALGIAMSAYCGQNLGAGKLDRVRKGLVISTCMGLIYAVFAFLVLYFGTPVLALLFLDSSETTVIGLAHQYMTIGSACYFLLSFLNVARYSIQRLGHSPFALLSGVFELLARAVVSLIFIPMGGFTAACFADPVAWICADLFLLPAFLYVVRKETKKSAAVQAE